MLDKERKQHIIFCRYSGMPLPSYADFPTLPIDFDAHILMRAPLEMLLDEIHKRKVLTTRQNRLLFIALLKQTDLCIFNYPATPDDRIIDIEFSRLIDITGYITSHRIFYHDFPKFHITKETSSLSNIHHIIERWYDVRISHEWKQSEKKELFDFHVQEELERKITDAIIKKKPITPTFNKNIIKWALNEVSISTISKKGILWARIFLTKDNKVCRMCNGKKLILNPMVQQMEECPTCDGKGRTSDISKLKFSEVQECRNYMVDNLPETTSYEATRKFVVLKHLGLKLQAIQQMNAKMGIELLSEVIPSAEEKGKGRIAKEPEEKDFSNKLEFLKALALFNSAQSIAESSDGDNILTDHDAADNEDDSTNIGLDEELEEELDRRNKEIEAEFSSDDNEGEDNE